MWNEAIICGRVGRDPEIRNLQNGGQVTTLSVATSEKWKDKSGEQKEKTEWHRVVLFGKLAEIAGDYAKKGSLVMIRGAIQTRKWKDQDGNDRWSTEIVVSGFDARFRVLSDGAGNGGSRQSSSRQKPADDFDDSLDSHFNDGPGGSSRDELDDEIPF